MKLTWYGHSAFKIEITDAVILIDPFLTGNPTFPDDLSVDKVAEGGTHVLLTHGHDDHIGDSIAILKQTGAQLTANFEICMWANGRGIDNINPMNSGGMVDVGPFQVAMTQALHSSSTQTEGGIAVYLGNPHGLVVKAPDEPVLFHMGDTDIFSDMALINEIHAPKIGLVPIGDRFTMGARSAALACSRYFAFDTIVPCHFGTFPILDQSAYPFVAALGSDGEKVRLPKPGETIEL